VFANCDLWGGYSRTIGETMAFPEAEVKEKFRR